MARTIYSSSPAVVTAANPNWVRPWRRDLFVKILEEARCKYPFVVHGYVINNSTSPSDKTEATIPHVRKFVENPP